jgi:hypothetical protein
VKHGLAAARKKATRSHQIQKAALQEGVRKRKVAPRAAAHHREQNRVSTAVSTAGRVTVPNAVSTNAATSAVTAESDRVQHQATGGTASFDHAYPQLAQFLAAGVVLVAVFWAGRKYEKVEQQPGPTAEHAGLKATQDVQSYQGLARNDVALQPAEAPRQLPSHMSDFVRDGELTHKGLEAAWGDEALTTRQGRAH